jgi:hypothetical protein
VAQQWYPQGTRPHVLINWDSFTNQGINAAWQGPFTDAVINAYTRWMNTAGVDLRFQFWGYTTKTSSGQGELLIQMDPQFGGGGPRLASTFGSFNALTVIFHRRDATTGTPWNFVPFNAVPGEFDMQTILMHELGHCHGLDHSASANDTMFGSYIYFQKFGPYEGDTAAVKGLYSDFAENRLRQLRSTDGAGSWVDAPNELTPYNNYQARTTLNPGTAAISASGLYLVGWSHPNRIPTSLRTDGTKFLFRRWFFYGGERSVHGPAYASDSNGTLLWAWVNNDDNCSLRVARSDNRGMDWGSVGVPANAQSGGTPGLAWTSVGGQSTWILAWSRFDRNDQTGTADIMVSLSTNNGGSWSAPTSLGAFAKACSGVAVAASGNNEVMVGFAWYGLATFGINLIRTLRCTVNAGQLQALWYMWPGPTTRIQPALAFDAAHGVFVMAWRGQNFLTTLNTMTAKPPDQTWGGTVALGWASHVAPALASIGEYGEAALWYAFEGP